ncbi:MAG TPA: hypothetical protein VH309_11805 [Elusimicrobiota bacterium]|nr:hypothetical protein [Elusimicrobiota bacterium]
MSRWAVAALAALLLVGAARAADAPSGQISGRVLTTEVATDPFAEGGAGSLVIVDKAGQTAEYSVLGTTKVMRDGKKIHFDATLVGDLVVKAKFDPATKTLTLLDLKSSGAVKPAKKAAPALIKGEVAFTDALKGVLSVQTLKGVTRDFAVVDATKVLRQAGDDAPQDIAFETVAVGDSVEVRSRDGKTADEIRVRVPAR